MIVNKISFCLLLLALFNISVRSNPNSIMNFQTTSNLKIWTLNSHLNPSSDIKIKVQIIVQKFQNPINMSLTHHYSIPMIFPFIFHLWLMKRIFLRYVCMYVLIYISIWHCRDMTLRHFSYALRHESSTSIMEH